jgi:hypothetical protein
VALACAQVGERFNIGKNRCVGSGSAVLPSSWRECSGVFRRSVEDTTGRIVALLRKELIGDAHFHVISFTGKDAQRLVLRFPAEARNRSIVSAAIIRSADFRRLQCRLDSV